MPQLLEKSLGPESYGSQLLCSNDRDLSLRVSVAPRTDHCCCSQFWGILTISGISAIYLIAVTIVPLPYDLIRANLPLWPRNLSVRNVTCRSGLAPATDTAGYARVSMKSGYAKTGSTIAVPAVSPVTCRPNIRWRSKIADLARNRRQHRNRVKTSMIDS